MTPREKMLADALLKIPHCFRLDEAREIVYEAITALAAIEQPAVEQVPDEFREIMAAVFREIEAKGNRNDGNAPGHDHQVPGVWDSDNGKLAGKPCAWCSLWNKAKVMLAAAPAAPAAQVTACSFPDRDQSTPAEKQGLFRKFEVRRIDGSDRPGGKHHGCEYFVLDMAHDAHATDALRAYAKSCKDTYPQLSADLTARFGEAQNADAKDAALTAITAQRDDLLAACAAKEAQIAELRCDMHGAEEARIAADKQRDELLAALKKLSGMKLNMIADGIVDKALASVKGGAS